MDITFNCNKCGQSIAIDEAGAGQLVDCPKCGAPVEIPYKSPPPSATSAPQPPVWKAATAPDHASRVGKARRVADAFAGLGTIILIVCVLGAVAALFGDNVELALVLGGTGVFNYFLWRAVHFGLHLLADIEENTRP